MVHDNHMHDSGTPEMDDAVALVRVARTTPVGTVPIWRAMSAMRSVCGMRGGSCAAGGR